MKLVERDEWNELLAKLAPKFGEDIELDALLFLVGIQELGQGARNFTKDEKINLIHIAVCRLLSNYGYYSLKDTDQDGWPHWEFNSKLPALKPLQQEQLIKDALIDYFSDLT